MRTKSLAAAAAICGVSLAFAGSAAAAPAWTIYPSQLSPQQRAEFYAAPLGSTGPFGDPTPVGCRWSRIQIPTAQGLEWVAQEDCDTMNNGR
jgi:hypothetical protein